MTDYTRTTFSLSKRIIEKLKKHGKDHKNCQRLVKLCLARFLQKLNLDKWSDKSTCQYNQEQCPETLDLYFSQSEIRTLKIIRITQSISISLLITIAIDTYLMKILSMNQLHDIGGNARRRYDLWCVWLNSIYEETKFEILNVGEIIKTNIVIRKKTLQLKNYDKLWKI